MFQRSVATSQCKNKRLIFSELSLHMQHLLTNSKHLLLSDIVLGKLPSIIEADNIDWELGLPDQLP